MKFKFLVSTVLVLSSFIVYAQDVELLSNYTTEYFRFTTILEKNINTKWNYFSISEMGAEYNNTNKLTFESNHFANYNLKNGFAITTGLGLQNNNVLPQLGISYSKEKKSWAYAFYPTVHYGISDKQMGASLNAIIGFTPAINTKWDFYNLALLDLDYDFGNAIQSQQYLNLGLQYNKKLHFGVNIDLEQVNIYNENNIAFGIFLGFNL